MRFLRKLLTTLLIAVVTMLVMFSIYSLFNERFYNQLASFLGMRDTPEKVAFLFPVIIIVVPLALVYVIKVTRKKGEK